MQINDVTKLLVNLFPIAEVPKVKEVSPRPEEGKNPQLSALEVGKEEKEKNYEKGKKRRKADKNADDKGGEEGGQGNIIDLVV